jgi:hypothetical protein
MKNFQALEQGSHFSLGTFSQGCGSGSAWIRIRVKSWIRIDIKVRFQEL